MKKETAIKLLCTVTAVATVCLLSLRYSTAALDLFSFIAYKSAVVNFATLPFTAHTSDEAQETTKEALPAEAPEQTQTEAVSLTVPPTAKLSKAQKGTEKAVSEELLVLPDDIKEMMVSAQKKGKKDSKEGSIKEKKYTNEGVTDKEGAVKVKNTNKTKINVKELLSQKLSFTVNKDEPAVLIFHTHTTESYQYIDRDFYSSSYTSRSTSADKNMVRIGKAIKSEIEKAGFKVIHDTTVHDTKYTGAYGRSRKTVEAYLEKYPSIEIVLDVHRDGIADYDGSKIKPTAVIEGKKTAQVMIISGCQEEGNGITGYEGWKENLVFALKLQKEMEEAFPGLTRPLYFCGRKYNMDMTKASVLLEVGSDSNTIEEAYYAGLCIGKAAGELLRSISE